MKHLFLAFIFLSTYFAFSQQKIIESFDHKIQNISILSFGLDNITIVNSNSNHVEIELLDENSNNHQIITNSLGSSFKISFKLQLLEEKKEVFRKFITKRIHRVNAIVKIPKHKSITVFGKHIDVISKSYQGNLKIYIDKGEVELNEITQKAEVRLFDGNVSAKTSKTNINVTSNNGTILVNDSIQVKKYSKKSQIKNKELIIKSINANIKLTSL